MDDVVDSAQVRAWNGYEGSQWARSRSRWDAINEGFNRPLLDAAAIGDRDSVLDIGCGAGRTTLLAAERAPGGRALGVDLSGPMLEQARASARQHGPANVSFSQGDAQVHPFTPAGFDVALSRYGVMFFADPVAAFTNIGRALRPGGRAAFICAAEPGENEWIHAFGALRGILPVGDFGRPGAPGMFSLADRAHVLGILSAAGFEKAEAVRVEAAGNWGQDAADAAAFMLDSGPGRHMLAQAGAEQHTLASRTLTDVLRAYEGDGGVWLRSVAWLVTARRPRGGKG
ncbi:class I SAM-dependent methyltransferase [Streptomyces sp. NPDC093094]|uniref:class I SAM-dependent methyltransferase n=1 Tax=Streptomyces sp. NPDC093094 TaxID=3366026 RepID=UPI003826598F